MTLLFEDRMATFPNHAHSATDTNDNYLKRRSKYVQRSAELRRRGEGKGGGGQVTDVWDGRRGRVSENDVLGMFVCSVITKILFLPFLLRQSIRCQSRS